MPAKQINHFFKHNAATSPNNQIQAKSEKQVANH
jgi:hypothetical protein